MKSFYNIEQTVLRRAPINLTKEDKHLFANDLNYELGEVEIHQTKNQMINGDMLVFALTGFNPESFQYRTTFRPSRINSLKFLVKNYLTKPKEIIKEGLWLTDAWSIGYFHWFADVFQKLFILKENGRLSQTAILILPEHFKYVEYIQTTLNLLSLKVKYINPAEVIKIQSLTYVKTNFRSGNFIEKTIRSEAEWFKQDIKTKVKEPTKLIYISRSKAQRRRVLNENELIPVFEKYNVEIIYLEEYTFDEQRMLLNSSKFVIGMHGAGLTNMLFMKKGTILEFRHPNSPQQNCFFSLANALNLDYFYLCGKPNLSDPHLSDLWVNPFQLEKIIMQMFEERI